MTTDINAEQPAPTATDGAPIWELVVADMRERDQVGRQRYGVPLQAHNGRDPRVDAYPEALDLAVYLRPAIEERKRPEPQPTAEIPPDRMEIIQRTISEMERTGMLRLPKDAMVKDGGFYKYDIGRVLSACMLAGVRLEPHRIGGERPAWKAVITGKPGAGAWWSDYEPAAALAAVAARFGPGKVPRDLLRFVGNTPGDHGADAIIKRVVDTLRSRGMAVSAASLETDAAAEFGVNAMFDAGRWVATCATVGGSAVASPVKEFALLAMVAAANGAGIHPALDRHVEVIPIARTGL
jgi:hypothetical protein